MQFGKLLVCRREIRGLMMNYCSELERTVEKLRERQKNYPEGKLRPVTRGKRNQYYWVKSDTDKYGKYISIKSKNLIRQLTKKRIEGDLLMKYQAELAIMKQVLAESDENDDMKLVEEYCVALQNAMRSFCEDYPMSDEEFAAQWREVEYEGLGFDPNDSTKYYTSRGERVRSRAEIIIANALDSAGIPYRFEYPLHLGKYNTVYPDFVCLNVRLRKEFVWEHLGMLDLPTYRKRNLEKLSDYMQAGYVQGENMIITMDGGEDTFDTRAISIMINSFLK